MPTPLAARFAPRSGGVGEIGVGGHLLRLKKTSERERPIPRPAQYVPACACDTFSVASVGGAR